MAKLGFSYLPRIIINPVTKQQEEIFTPYIQVRLSAGHGNLTQLIDALVDSGADGNLFPLQLGELLGINFKKAVPKVIYGIGNAQITAYTASINIWVNNIKYQTEADFSDKQQTLLLGRNGFFNLFKELTFNEHEKLLYLETI